MARRTFDIALFARQIHFRINTLEMKYEKLKQMYELCCSVVGEKGDPSADAASLQEEQALYKSKGALLMHKVFTGNLGNKIEITKLNEIAEPLSSMDGTVDRLGEQSQQVPVSEMNPTGSNEEKLATPREAPAKESRADTSSKSMHTDLDATPASIKPEVNMESLNLLINFLNQLCDQDDVFSSTRILKHCPLFQLGHISLLQVSQIKMNHLQKYDSLQYHL